MIRITVVAGCIVLLFFVLSCGQKELSQEKKCEISYQTGNNHFLEGRLDDALLESNKSVADCPRIWKYWFLKSSIEYGLGNLLSAEESAKQCNALKKNCSKCYDMLGKIATAGKHWEEAREYFEKALNNPEYRTPVITVYNMGIMYELQGKYSEALEQFEEAGKIDPSYDRAFLHKGIMLMKLMRADEAVFAFKQVTVINKKFCDAWVWLVKAYLKSGQYRKAKESAKQGCTNLGDQNKCCRRIQLLLR